jgi:hypothetical protein
MSCILVRHTPIGGIGCASESVGGVSASSRPVGGIAASAFPAGGISVKAVSRGGISVRMWQECRVNIRPPYLEIEPTIVWVLNGWTSNDVYSNVHWNVE